MTQLVLGHWALIGHWGLNIGTSPRSGRPRLGEQRLDRFLDAPVLAVGDAQLAGAVDEVVIGIAVYLVRRVHLAAGVGGDGIFDAVLLDRVGHLLHSLGVAHAD